MRYRSPLASSADIDPHELRSALRRAEQGNGRQQFPERFLLNSDQRSGSNIIVSKDEILEVPDLPDERLREIHPSLAKVQGSEAFEELWKQSAAQRWQSTPLIHAPDISEVPAGLIGVEHRVTLKGQQSYVRVACVTPGKRVNLNQIVIGTEELFPGGGSKAPAGWHTDLQALDQLQDMTPQGLMEEVALAVLGQKLSRARQVASSIVHAGSIGLLRSAWAMSQEELIAEVVLANHPVWPELPGELQREALQSIGEGHPLERVLQVSALRMLKEKQRSEGKTVEGSPPRCPTWRTPLETWSHSERYREACQTAGVATTQWDPYEGSTDFQPKIAAPAIKRKAPPKSKAEKEKENKPERGEKTWMKRSFKT